MSDEKDEKIETQDAEIQAEDLLDDEMETILQEDALPVGPGY